MKRLWRWVGGLPGWLSGASRHRPYHSAIDRDIEMRDWELDDLARRVAAYEERADAIRELERQRRQQNGDTRV